MRRLALTYLIILLLLLTFSSACSGQKADLGKEFALHIGQTTDISGENLQVTFTSVVEDSRCPTGVSCIWAGQVSCAVQIIYRNATRTIVLTQPGLNDLPDRAKFEDYIIEFRVEPYPQAEKQIADFDYTLLMKFSNK